MNVANICAALIAVTAPDISGEAESVCHEVVEAAESRGIEPSVLLSIAWHESRLRLDVVHPQSGAAGPLQVMPLLQTDDLIDDGARIFREWMDSEAAACVEAPTSIDLSRALCRYACGYRCEAPCYWARTRLGLAERIELAMLATY